MAMIAAQITAFKTASGNIDISVVSRVRWATTVRAISLGSMGDSGFLAWLGKYQNQGCRACPICYPSVLLPIVRI